MKCYYGFDVPLFEAIFVGGAKTHKVTGNIVSKFEVTQYYMNFLLN